MVYDSVFFVEFYKLLFTSFDLTGVDEKILANFCNETMTSNIVIMNLS